VLLNNKTTTTGLALSKLGPNKHKLLYISTVNPSAVFVVNAITGAAVGSFDTPRGGGGKLETSFVRWSDEKRSFAKTGSGQTCGTLMFKRARFFSFLFFLQAP
jgi:hypothetical protein